MPSARVCCDGNRKLEQICKHLNVAVTTALSELDGIFIPKQRARTGMRPFLQSRLALAREGEVGQVLPVKEVN